MNKYDQVLSQSEFLHNVVSVQEAIRSKKMTKKQWLMDLFIGVSSATVEDLKLDGTYYVLGYKDHITLLHINKQLECQTWDVTANVNQSKHPKKFEFNEYYYQVVRKINLTKLE